MVARLLLAVLLASLPALAGCGGGRSDVLRCDPDHALTLYRLPGIRPENGIRGFQPVTKVSSCDELTVLGTASFWKFKSKYAIGNYDWHLVALKRNPLVRGWIQQYAARIRISRSAPHASLPPPPKGLPDLSFGPPEATIGPGSLCATEGETVTASDFTVSVRNRGVGAAPRTIEVRAGKSIERIALTRYLMPGEAVNLPRVYGAGTRLVLDPSRSVRESDEKNNVYEVTGGETLVCTSG